MLTKCISLALITFSASLHAGDLDDALNAVKSQQQQYNNEQEFKRIEAQKRAEIKAEQEAVRVKSERAAAEAKAEKLAADAKAERQAIQEKAEAAAFVERQAMEADKKREQSFEDEVRRMELEEKKIALEEKKAKAARANDYIDADLNRKKAETDVVKSAADATRNVSEGQKEMMTGVGKGAESEGKRWFK